LLEDVAEAVAPIIAFIVDVDFSCIGFDELCEDIEDGRLAAAGGAQKTNKLTMRSLNRHLIKDGNRTAAPTLERLGKTLDFDTGHGSLEIQLWPPAQHAAFNRLQNSILEYKHDERKSERPRQHVGHRKAREGAIDHIADTVG